ncbi:MAG TPA: cation-translocating P-type ATPase [Steroidobacteraceae bacterium]|nr:cation-translocating P-type ATPase [Steroidobacteraceae bacterium]
MSAADLLNGLSDAEAHRRLAAEGFNELPAREARSLWATALAVLGEPMFALLIVAALIYGVIGELAEAALLLAFATLSIAITFIQRGRSERALAALRDLTSPRALVIRDGRQMRIPGREVARGDLVIVGEGDRVPADGVLIAGDHVQVDESLLTGESVAVRKRPTHAIPAALDAPGGEGTATLFAGTLVVRGSGRVLILATGPRSAVGAIGGSLAGLEREQPRLERETRRIVLIFATVGAVCSVSAVLLYGFLRHDWLEALLGGIALGMALLPEEFPLVLTVFTVMGAWRLSQSRVLTRRATAIETLGAATVLCTDKTGTLTRNLMSVAMLRAGDEAWSAGAPPQAVADSPVLHRLLETAMLASDAHLVDPMERAIAVLRDTVGGARRDRHLLREYPLRPQLLAMGRAWRAGEDAVTLAIKGAPEAVAGLCGLSVQERAALDAQVDALAGQGIRVLAVASASVDAASLPESLDGARARLLGLVGFADPLRESVPEAVRECRVAGIRVIMITGDYPATARAIARQAGIENGELLAGADLELLDDAELAEHVRRVLVFARISPQQKLRIVNALKAAGEVVAMTGDGVNDAPALKAAHIGIAMGGRGTDVAREAASLVLLDDDFASIVRAVRLGRRIFDNLRKAMSYILAIHVPIAGLALLPALLGWPLLLTPMLIALLELIIDPACSVILEAESEERDVMRRPPRDPHGHLVSGALFSWSMLQGIIALGAVLAAVTIAFRRGVPAAELRALGLVMLVALNLALIFVNRTFSASIAQVLTRPNRALGIGLALVVVLLAVLFGWPAVRGFFELAVPDARNLVTAASGLAIALLLLQVVRVGWRGRLQG